MGERPPEAPLVGATFPCSLLIRATTFWNSTGIEASARDHRHAVAHAGEGADPLAMKNAAHRFKRSRSASSVAMSHDFSTALTRNADADPGETVGAVFHRPELEVGEDQGGYTSAATGQIRPLGRLRETWRPLAFQRPTDLRAHRWWGKARLSTTESRSYGGALPYDDARPRSLSRHVTALRLAASAGGWRRAHGLRAARRAHAAARGGVANAGPQAGRARGGAIAQQLPLPRGVPGRAAGRAGAAAGQSTSGAA